MHVLTLPPPPMHVAGATQSAFDVQVGFPVLQPPAALIARQRGPPPPPAQQRLPALQSPAAEQTCVDPAGQVTWHMGLPPPPRPPVPVQQTIPPAQLDEPIHGGVRQVIGLPLPPPPPHICAPGQLLPPSGPATQSCVAPAEQELMHVVVLPVAPPPPPSGTAFGAVQHTSLPGHEAALQAVMFVVPAGQRVGLDTHV